MGFLFRSLRATANTIREMAFELRSHWFELLSGELPGASSGAADSGARSVLLYGHRLFTGNLSERNSTEAAGKTTQSFSPYSASIPPICESVDSGSGRA